MLVLIAFSFIKGHADTWLAEFFKKEIFREKCLENINQRKKSCTETYKEASSQGQICVQFFKKKLVFKGRNENTCRRSVGKILKYGGI